MLMRANMARIPALSHDFRLGPDGTISINLMPAIRLIVLLALRAVETGVDLCSDSDSFSDFDERYFGADA